MNDANIITLPTRARLAPILPNRTPPNPTWLRRVRPGDVVTVKFRVHAPRAYVRRSVLGILVRSVSADGVIIGTVADPFIEHGATVVVRPEMVRGRMTGERAWQWLAKAQGALDCDKARRA